MTNNVIVAQSQEGFVLVMDHKIVDTFATRELAWDFYESLGGIRPKYSEGQRETDAMLKEFYKEVKQ